MNIYDPSSNTFAIIDGIPVDIESCKIDKEIKHGGSEFMYNLVIREDSQLHKHCFPQQIILFVCGNIFMIFPSRVDIETSMINTGSVNKYVMEIPTSWSKRVDSVEEVLNELNEYNQKL